MAPTEIEQPAASKRCRGPRRGQPAASERSRGPSSGQPAASSRCRGPSPGQLAASKRCRGPKASSWLPPSELVDRDAATGCHRRGRRSVRPNSQMPRGDPRLQPGARQLPANHRNERRPCTPTAPRGSDDHVLGQRAAIAQPSRCGKRSHSRKIGADVEWPQCSRPFSALGSRAREAQHAHAPHTRARGAPMSNSAVSINHSYRDAHQSTAAERAALSTEDLLPINLDIQDAATVMIGAWPRISALRTAVQDELPSSTSRRSTSCSPTRAR